MSSPLSMPSAMLRVLWAPRSAVDAVLARGGGFNWLFALLALELLLERPEVATVVGMRLTDAPLAAASNLVRYAVAPAFFTFLAGVAMHYRTRRRERHLDMELGAALVTLGWVPHTLWLAASVLLATSGLDHPLMPHHPNRSAQRLGEGWQVVALAIEFAPTALFTLFAYRHALSGHAAAPRVAPPFRRKFLPAALASSLLIAALASNALYVSQHWAEIRPVGTGDQLPTARLPGLERGSLDLESLRGNVVLVDFWATWCGPCRQTLPTLQKFHDDLRGRGFTLLSVNVEPGQQASVREFMSEHGLSFPVYVDDGTLQARMHVDTLPTAFVVDANGVIRDMHVGAWGMGQLRGELETLLEEASTAKAGAPGT